MANDPSLPKPLLTVAEVADWLSVSASLVYQIVESGQLPVHRIGNLLRRAGRIERLLR